MDVPDIKDQRAFWNRWDRVYREESNLDVASLRRKAEVLSHLQSLGLHRPKILEVGCANGWLSGELATYGSVVGTDLADECIAIAQQRYPHIRFVAGNFFTLDLGCDYDVVVCVDSLASVADQEGFVKQMAHALVEGGSLILTTQNPVVFSRRQVDPLAPGQVRQWASRSRLRQLLQPYFTIKKMTTVLPDGNRGILRLVNSYKLNRILSAVFGESRIAKLKELAGCGQTIVVLAKRRSILREPHKFKSATHNASVDSALQSHLHE
jgi:2-polyprenyl-3-methyl-5-hydroxy-6-metoxy-1,4-benzoquinol methylase